jgi:hypothetical protein
MQASPKFGFHFAQLGLQSLADRLPQHGKPSLARGPTDVGEPKKGKGFRLPLTTVLPVLPGAPYIRAFCECVGATSLQSAAYITGKNQSPF